MVYVRNLIAERAREEYSALVESTGSTNLHASYKFVAKSYIIWEIAVWET